MARREIRVLEKRLLARGSEMAALFWSGLSIVAAFHGRMPWKDSAAGGKVYMLSLAESVPTYL